MEYAHNILPIFYGLFSFQLTVSKTNSFGEYINIAVIAKNIINLRRIKHEKETHHDNNVNRTGFMHSNTRTRFNQYSKVAITIGKDTCR